MLPSDETTKTCGGRATRDDSLSSLSEETLTLRAVSPTDILPEKGVNVADDSPKPQSKAPSSRDASKPSSFKRRPGDEFRSTSRSASFRPEFSYDPNVPQVYGTPGTHHTQWHTPWNGEDGDVRCTLDLYLSRADMQDDAHVEAARIGEMPAQKLDKKLSKGKMGAKSFRRSGTHARGDIER